MALVSHDGMRVVRAGTVLPMAVRLSKRIGPSDYVVVDADDNVLSDPLPTEAKAEAELCALAGLETVGGLPVVEAVERLAKQRPCFVPTNDALGTLFLHDPERPDRLAEALA